MEVKIEIDDVELREMVMARATDLIAKEMVNRYDELSNRGGVKTGIEKGIKEAIYKHKDEIIEKCVNRASAEIVRKAVPKLLDRVQITGVVATGKEAAEC